MKIDLPDQYGRMSAYQLKGNPVAIETFPRSFNRIAFSAAHVVADPFTNSTPSGSAAIDWDATMAFRRHLSGLGLGIAEAMDTAQRGMGLDWNGALELIGRTIREVPNALVFSGAGTDHLLHYEARSLDDVRRAYLHQIHAIQKLGGRIILMASRALAKLARSPEDYISVYSDVLKECDQPVILHWLGEMFDPALSGYWGDTDFDKASATCLAVIRANAHKVDGIKISLLDKNKEIIFRRQLPQDVKMYTGDDYNYPELIEGDAHGFSHALLGIFDPLAPVAALALSRLATGDNTGFRNLLDSTVPLARHLFRTPTQYYKTGIVFLAWLNGFQQHFIMLNGHQSMRPLPYFTDLFKHADACGLLQNPDLAVQRMKQLLAVYGVS
jgi:hypothetical protein